MKPKIGIMTYYAVQNFGAALQAFALQQSLSHLGAEVEFLRFFDKHNESRPTNHKDSIIKTLLLHKALRDELMFHLKRYMRVNSGTIANGVAFQNFRNDFMHISREPYYDMDDLKEANARYDAFVSGSDMVWTPIGQCLSAYFLQFADKEKRLSYAPSMTGCQNYKPEEKAEIRKYLQEMQLLSCREQEGIEYVKELTGMDAVLTADPTLLFTKEEWKKELKLDEKKHGRPYILSYMFGGMPTCVRKNIEAIADENNLEIRYVPLNYEERDSELKAQRKGPYGPREFVDLFLNASFVVTNTFHGVLFSLIGERPFVAYHREKGNAWKTNETRISNLLTDLKIENRYVDIEQKIDNKWLQLDYTSISTIIAEKRQTSLDYLRTIVSFTENNANKRQNTDFIKNVRDLSPKKCTGCGLCSELCAYKAIQMVDDIEGFMVPKVDASRCKECGLCAKKCPSIHPLEKAYPKKPVLCVSKDKIREKSASGGAFATIAKYFIEDLKGVVYGCVLDADMKCHHAEATTMDELTPMQNSKYIQSIVGDCYKRAKKSLNDNQYVLFTGTPCQVASLKAYLGKDYDKLLTMEVICHGVPNQKFWKKYVLSLNKTGELKSYTFRNRDNRATQGATLEATLEVNKSIKHVHCLKDPYYAPFVRCESYRPSCYYCQYARKERGADITIGDCDSRKDYPGFFPLEEKSSVLLNNEKGLLYWEKVKGNFEYTELDYKKEYSVNTPLLVPSPKPIERDDLYNDLDLLPWNSFAKKYVEQKSFSRRLLGKTLRMLKSLS